MPRLETIRAFVAVNLSIEATQAVVEKRRGLLPEVEKLPMKVSWVPPSNLHVTMKFLGDIDRELGDGIASALAKAGTEIEPFEVSVGEWGSFPSAAKPRVLWVGVEDPSEGLTALHEAVERHLGELGFKKEKRSFHPHITMGRVRKGREDLSPLFEEARDDRSVSSRVEEVVLYESRLMRSGAEYRILGRASLKAGSGEAGSGHSTSR